MTKEQLQLFNKDLKALLNNPKSREEQVDIYTVLANKHSITRREAKTYAVSMMYGGLINDL